MDETWRSFATAHYRKLKAKNPSATFKDALRSAAPLYQEQKNNLYKVRGQVAALHRAKPHAKHQAKADRVEAQQYGGVLRDLVLRAAKGLQVRARSVYELSWGNVTHKRGNATQRR
jgi:hypothetical protein